MRLEASLSPQLVLIATVWLAFGHDAGLIMLVTSVIIASFRGDQR